MKVITKNIIEDCALSGVYMIGCYICSLIPEMPQPLITIIWLVGLEVAWILTVVAYYIVKLKKEVSKNE